jgi:predicted nucleic acid-binding protein
VAPDLILTEAANAYWAMVRGSRLLMIHAERNLEELPRYFDRLYPVYDCVYLALATRLECRLITADRKFHLKATDHYPIDLLPFETD